MWFVAAPFLDTSSMYIWYANLCVWQSYVICWPGGCVYTTSCIQKSSPSLFCFLVFHDDFTVWQYGCESAIIFYWASSSFPLPFMIFGWDILISVKKHQSLCHVLKLLPPTSGKISHSILGWLHYKNNKGSFEIGVNNFKSLKKHKLISFLWHPY